MECHDDTISSNSKVLSKPTTIVHKQRFKCYQCRLFDDTVKKSKRASKQRSSGFAGFTDTEIHEKKRFFVDEKMGIMETVVKQQIPSPPPIAESDTATTVATTTISTVVHPSMDWCFDAVNGTSGAVPDASEWDFQQVHDYFSKYFPKDVVDVFRDQEIDGSTLLLFKRTDVLRRLNLKLGPALRVYAHVLRLQTRSNDIRLTWM